MRGNEYLKKHPIIMLSGGPEQAINSYELCQTDVFVDRSKGYAELPALVKRQLRRAEWDRALLKNRISLLTPRLSA